MKFIIIFFVALSSIVHGQTLGGVFKGSCAWDKYTVPITIVVSYTGGNSYSGVAVETQTDKSISFNFTMFKNDATGKFEILQQNINTITFKYSDKTITYHTMKAYTTDDEKQRLSICLCDDTINVSFWWDSTMNHFQTACTENLVFWSLAQYNKSKPKT